MDRELEERLIGKFCRVLDGQEAAPKIEPGALGEIERAILLAAARELEVGDGREKAAESQQRSTPGA